jgi:hypothetical protein
MVQLAESAKQVKAMRNCFHSDREIPVYFQTLKKRITQRSKSYPKDANRKLESVSQLEHDDAVFAGKEFLVSFDASYGLNDVWLSGFELACINFLREDLEFRQRQARGLPG